MSAFLSKIHYQLYDKIKYQAHICELLHTMLYKQNYKKAPFVAILPVGVLDEVIHHDQIHGWLLNQIEFVETHLSNLLEDVKQANQMEAAKDVCFQAGKELGKTLILHSVLDVFQHFQKYMLDGMPCDHGIAIICKDEDKLVFQCTHAVHSKITDIALFWELRLRWMQGFLQDSSYTISFQQVNTFTIEENANV